jgi:hypothetical protein
MGLEQCCSNSLTLSGSKNRQFLVFKKNLQNQRPASSSYSRNIKELAVFMKEPGSLEGSLWKFSNLRYIDLGFVQQACVDFE